jgi:hypothetical protein
MPADEALRHIQRDLADNPAVNVVLASRPYGQGEDDLRRLNIGQELQQGFQRIASRAVEGVLRLVEYAPGYKLDPDEVAWIDLGDAPNLAAVVQRVARFQDLVIFQQNADDFLDYLAYYVLFARIGPRRAITLFRKTSEKLELGRSHKMGAILRRGQYDQVQETLFLFDEHIDSWSDGRYIFVRNIPNFERIFRYYEALQQRAEQTVDAVAQRIPIANLDEFRTACTTQPRFMTKLAVIASKPYLALIGMADIQRAIREHNLPVEFRREDGEEKLVFEPDPARRWILLKLLDDDYLNSVMTRLRYEVNSKIARGAPDA